MSYYRSKAEYDDACYRLAAHLNTLNSAQISEVYADGSTTDADDTMWVPYTGGFVESDIDGSWFIEEYGAAAHFTGGEWVGREPGADELSDAGLALWGAENGEYWGYPL